MLEFLLAAFFLGAKHSFDADHLAATSNLFLRSKSILNSMKLAFSWAIGHMTTAILITIIFIVSKETFFHTILGKLEILAPVMLVSLGGLTIYNAMGFHYHGHKHGGKTHSHFHAHLKKDETKHLHRHFFGIGIVHGLASNDELLTFLTLTVGLSNLFEIALGTIVFSLGVIFGMIIFSIIFAFSFLKIQNQLWVKRINFSMGIVSIIYGFSIVLRI